MFDRLIGQSQSSSRHFWGHLKIECYLGYNIDIGVSERAVTWLKLRYQLTNPESMDWGVLTNPR